MVGFALAGLVGVACLVFFLQKRTLRVADEAVSNERKRIARDLHDEFGSLVVDLAGKSGGATQETSAPHPVRQALDRMVWSLATERGSMEDFATFVAEYVPERLAGKGVAVKLDLPLDLPQQMLSAEQRHALGAALNEALTNILAHAGASEVSAALQCSNRQIKLTITDNGCGFDPALASEKRRGLQNFRSRFSELGGEFMLHSREGEGTRLEFVLPLGNSH